MTDCVSRRTVSNSACFPMSELYGPGPRTRYKNRKNTPCGLPPLPDRVFPEDIPMKTSLILLAASLSLQGVGQAPAGGRVGVLNLRDCLDKAKNSWIADID